MILMSIDQLYAKAIRDQTGLFATWLPNAEIKIGHYGTIKGALFQPLNQLNELDATPSPATANYDFTIHADRSINTEAKALAEAGVSSGNVLLEVSFHKESAVTFSAPDGVITRVDNIQALGERLVSMLNVGDWHRENSIVVEIVTAPQATIIASLESGAQVKFEVAAKTPVSGNVMAKLDESTSLRVSKGVGVKIVGTGPVTPLFRLAFLKSRLLRDPKIVFRDSEGVAVKPTQVVKISEEHSLEIY
jgi:hypothetical protein